MLVEPKGTSRSRCAAPQALVAMGEGGGAAVMFDPLRNVHVLTAQPVTRSENG